jgi:WD40 repeat protein
MMEGLSTIVSRRAGRSLALLLAIAVPVMVLASGRLRAEDTQAAPLPPRALVQIGTDDLRTREPIADLAFSPDGRLIAAAERPGAPSKIEIFDARTGRPVRRIVPPDPDEVSVVCLAFSPDGTKLAWGEPEGAVALWDLPGDRLLHRASLHERAVNAVAFSPDGRLLASGGDDGSVRVRSVERLAGLAGKAVRSRQRGEERTLRDPDSRILGLAFTPDGTRLVAGATARASIIVWRLSDGQVLKRITETHGTRGSRIRGLGPRSVAVTPDGRRILSAGYSFVPRSQTRIPYGSPDTTVSEVRSWDIETEERRLDLVDDEHAGYGNVALSPDGRRVAVADFGVIRILDADTGRPVRWIEAPGSDQGRPAFSPDGALIALPVDRAIHVFEVRSGRRRLQGEVVPAGRLQSAAWSPSGDRIATGHGDGLVRVWDAATGRLIWHRRLTPALPATVGVGLPILMAFTVDGRRLIAAGQRYDPIANRNGLVTVYEAASGTLVREIPQPSFYGAALAPDGRIIVLNTGQGHSTPHLLGVEPETGRERWSAPPEGQRAEYAHVIGMQIRAKTPLLEAATSDGHVIRFNALTGREIRRFRVDGRPPEERDALPDRPSLLRATFSADGRTLGTIAREWVYLWDVESGTLRREIQLSHPDGAALALSPDGRTLAIATGPYPEDAIQLVDVETGKEWLVLRPVDKAPRVMVFSADGARLFTGFDRGSGTVWDVRRPSAPADVRPPTDRDPDRTTDRTEDTDKTQIRPGPGIDHGSHGGHG